MPALPDVPGVVRIDLKYLLSEDLSMLNRFFFKFTGALSQADATTWAGTIGTDFTAAFHASLTSDMTLVEVEVTDLTTTVSARGVDTTLRPMTNAVTGLPGGVSFNIDFLLARRYRGGKPKLFLPGMIDEYITDEQRWDLTSATAILGHWETFIGQVKTNAPGAVGADSHVNVSYFQGFTNIVRPSGRADNVPKLRPIPVVDTVTGYRYDPRPGSQRRRNLQGR